MHRDPAYSFTIDFCQCVHVQPRDGLSVNSIPVFHSGGLCWSKSRKPHLIKGCSVESREMFKLRLANETARRDFHTCREVMANDRQSATFGSVCFSNGDADAVPMVTSRRPHLRGSRLWVRQDCVVPCQQMIGFQLSPALRLVHICHSVYPSLGASLRARYLDSRH